MFRTGLAASAANGARAQRKSTQLDISMKPIFAIISAAATALAALIRMSTGNDGMHWIDPDAASEIPPMTPKLVERIAQTGATDQEIADRFLVDVGVIQRDFADVLRSSRALHNIAIRGCQLELARKLNGPILVWIGRNSLRQTNSIQASDEKMPETTDDPESPGCSQPAE
jgi:hypothetical protein